MDNRLKQQLEFSLEIDKEKNIFRQTHLSGGGRRENDAEHAWHMAIMAYLLKEYANDPVDIGKVMLMYSGLFMSLIGFICLLTTAISYKFKDKVFANILSILLILAGIAIFTINIIL